MTQEDKELLLKDLSARLIYKVMVNYKGLIRPLFGINPTQHYQITLDNAIDGEHNGLELVNLDIDTVELKPYLRSLSSMTEEEWEEYNNLMFHSERYADDYAADFDWLNAHHFDYRRLIEKGLALEAPEGMYNIK